MNILKILSVFFILILSLSTWAQSEDEDDAVTQEQEEVVVEKSAPAAEDDCDTDELANKPFWTMSKAEKKCWNDNTQMAGLSLKGLLGSDKEQVAQEIKVINYSWNNQSKCFSNPGEDDCPTSEYALYLYTKYFKNSTSSLEEKLRKKHNADPAEILKRAKGLKAFIKVKAPTAEEAKAPKPSGRETGCKYLDDKMTENKGLSTIEYNIYIQNCL